MTKCLFKALKAVDLEQHTGLFRSLGYDSAGSLTRFRTEHFERLHLNEQELLRLISLLDVLKEASGEGKVGRHYFQSARSNKQSSTGKPVPIRASWSDETNQQQQQHSQTTKFQQSNDNIRTKRSTSTLGRASKTGNNHPNEMIFQRPSTVLSRSPRFVPSRTVATKTFFNRPLVQHVKVKSYNYGVPVHRRSKTAPQRGYFQQDSPNHHGGIFVSASHQPNETITYGKPAEIYVYARKRPLLATEGNFQDAITVPDSKRILVAENKANLDCSPLLKKTEFQFDQVFNADASNKQVFDYTVLPFLSLKQRPNLTYICFGQTGSGKSHTIFGSKTTDGLLVHCTQLLLHEMDTQSDLICSFYEIYNNQVYDLNNPGKRLFVREDGNRHVNVIGVTELAIHNVDCLRAVIDDGLARRHHGKSAFNSNSSRSHAVFQIALKNKFRSADNFRLIFIDLAGSERATDAQNNQRQTRREGAQINWSLLALKECIRSMDMTHSHAPFRQSKLTHILRDSLVGSKTRTCLMANVSPPNDCCQCSLNTLQYASRIRDISMRHRTRSVPVGKMPSDLFDETIRDSQAQPTFKPATASTPVQRLISSTEQAIPTFHLQAGLAFSGERTGREDLGFRPTKTIDIDWQVADDDLPGKPLKSSTREWKHSQPAHRYPSARIDPSPSSYFPEPQSNIPPVDSRPAYNSHRLMNDDGNERQWKTVPAPVTRRPSDENPYSSATGTESLGTKIIQAASNEQRQQKPTKKNHSGTRLKTTGMEQAMHSDRQTTPRDQADFFTNRDHLLTILSSRLSSANRRSSSATTPKNSKGHSHGESQSKNIVSSASRSTARRLKSSSSSSTISLASHPTQEKKSLAQRKKPQVPSSVNVHPFDSTVRRSSNRVDHSSQRTVPLRVQHSSASEERDRRQASSYSTRSRAHPTKSKNEPKQPVEASIPAQTPNSSPALVPSVLLQAPLDQVKLLYNRSLSPTSIANINNPWLMSTSFPSPSKEFGLRVSDQLSALRSLLERRVIEHDDFKQHRNDSSSPLRSPKAVVRDSYPPLRHSPVKANLRELLSDMDDDDDDQEVARNFHHLHEQKQREEERGPSSSSVFSNTQEALLVNHRAYEQHSQPSLSSLSNELNQARVSSSTASSLTSTITSNLAAKVETHENQMFLNGTDGIQSHPMANHNSPGEKVMSGTSRSTSFPTSDSEHHSSSIPQAQTSSGDFSFVASQSRSPILLPPFSTLNVDGSLSLAHDQLLDSGKGSSLLTGLSFDTLMNSLKSMRERSLDFVVRAADDQLIPVAE